MTAISPERRAEIMRIDCGQCRTAALKSARGEAERPNPRDESTWPIAIDPYGCGCTECLTGQYVPLEQATDVQLAAMLRGDIRDNTNTGELQITITVRRTWGDFTRELDPALLDIAVNTERD